MVMGIPESIQELQDAVLAHRRVLAVGARTKLRLSTLASEDVSPIEMTKLSGMIEYEPSEYTFTALAGTPVKLIDEILAEKNQFLPCSVALVATGATLGGTVASGLSGAGRFRFGGLRDFLLGIRYVSGEGTLIAAGGKVVKNAAGFDLPKFMVGSLGRFGILAEATFKVFPRPSAFRTLAVACRSHEEAVSRLCEAAVSRWELSALEYAAPDRKLFLRLGGPDEALRALSDGIESRWPGDAKVLDADEAGIWWRQVREFEWRIPGGALVKVPLSPARIAEFQREMEALGIDRAHYSAGGNVAYLSLPPQARLAELSDALMRFELTGLTFLGAASVPLWLGTHSDRAIDRAVKKALDPQGRFPELRRHETDGPSDR